MHDPGKPAALDWCLLALITVFGGSAFAAMRIALETMPPAAISLMRIWIGAVAVYAIMRQGGRRLPPFFQRAKDGRLHVRRSWRTMSFVGIVGAAVPFFFFPWAQQWLDSSLAGIYMAFMPIWTVALAYFFAGESLSIGKIAGFVLGFCGILVLIGPDAISGIFGADLVAQLALLIATLCYAIATVMMRRAAPIRPRIFAAGAMIAASVAATPALFLFELNASEWSPAAIAAIIGLGLFPSGINTILIVILVRRAGAGFMALSNYLTPLWAVAVGALLLGERLAPSALIACALILTGVAVSQRPQNTQAKS